MPCIAKSRVATSTLASKDEATIPKDIRKGFNLYIGDRLKFVGDEDDRVLVLSARRDLSEVAWMPRRRPSCFRDRDEPSDSQM